MGSKNISITDEAYDELSREKRSGESFTDAILRLTRRNGKIMDCFGAWQMSDKEEEAIFTRELPAGWRRSAKRLKVIGENEMPRH